MPELVPTALLERGCSERCDLTSTDLRAVVALISAKRVGRPGATCRELRELTGVRQGSNMLKLERQLWVVAVAKVEKTREVVWAPHPRAAVRLGLNGWQTVLFTDEELTRVDANLPDFLKPLPVREVELHGPELANTASEASEGERAAS